MSAKNLKELSKKKGVRVGAVALVVVLAGSIVGTQVYSKKNVAAAVSVSVESAKAQTGNISTTITGTGNLQAGDTVDISVPSGIEIEEVKVSKGDTVTNGQVLATVNSASVASALTETNENLTAVSKKLSSSGLTDLQKEEYNAIYAKLTARKNALTSLHETLAITSTADGVVGTIGVSEGGTTTKSSGSSSDSSGSSDSGSSTTSGKSNTSAKLTDSSVLQTASYEATTYAAGNSKVLKTATATSASEDETLATASEGGTDITVVTDYSKLAIPSPVTGETGIAGIDPEETKDQGYEITSITWDCNGEFQADTAYTATIELKALAGYTFTEEHTPVLDCSAYECKISGNGEKNRLTITAKYEKTEAAKENGKSSEEEASGEENKEQENKEQENTSGSMEEAAMTEEASYDTGASEATSSSSGSSSSSSDSSSDSSSYETSEATAFTLSTQDNFKLSLSVDELDILSVKQGQTATITLNAASGQEFEGTVTKVGTVGTTSGSSAKYTVEITIPKQDNMLIGMTAAATINVSESDNAVLIPLDALQEEGGKSFVYTSTDSDGNLSGKTEVETGLSNETQVEITSGLADGDTVYYETTSTSSGSDGEMSIMMGDDSAVGGDMGGGPGGDSNGGDMGGGPGGGGEAPSGGGQAPN